MEEPDLTEWYRSKVIGLQLEAAGLTNAPYNKGRKDALKKMAMFYIEQLEKKKEE